MSGRYFRQTEIGRRMQAGESIPVWRPPGQQPPAQRAAPAAPPLPLEVRPISAVEAREAARAINEWAKGDGTEIESDTIRLLCQWVLRVTRGAT